MVRHSGPLDHVETVLGPVRPDALGPTLMHEHILCDLYRVSGNVDGLLNDHDLAASELALFAEAGGRTVVEATTKDLGRDPSGLRAIAQRTGLQIVMGSGWYRDPYYPANLDERPTNDLADEIVRDLEVTSGTPIRAGIIGELGCDRHYISAREERVFRAAARAHEATNVTITTHAVFSNVGLAQIDLLAEEGVSPERIIVGHADSHPDPSYHEAIAQRGAWVQFDRVSARHAVDRDRRIAWVMNLARQGFLDRLLLSSDVCVKSDLHAYGGTGYDYLLTGFRPALGRAGLGDTDLEMIYVDNPRRALTGGR